MPLLKLLTDLKVYKSICTIFKYRFILCWLQRDDNNMSFCFCEETSFIILIESVKSFCFQSKLRKLSYIFEVN